jgi:hypothetical protein
MIGMFVAGSFPCTTLMLSIVAHTVGPVAQLGAGHACPHAPDGNMSTIATITKAENANFLPIPIADCPLFPS